MWLACATQEEIADACDVHKDTVSEICRKLADLPNSDKAAADHATEFDPPLYNIWKQQEKTAGADFALNFAAPRSFHAVPAPAGFVAIDRTTCAKPCNCAFTFSCTAGGCDGGGALANISAKAATLNGSTSPCAVSAPTIEAAMSMLADIVAVAASTTSRVSSGVIWRSSF
jgi:hypothetical protein